MPVLMNNNYNDLDILTLYQPQQKCSVKAFLIRNNMMSNPVSKTTNM